MLNKTVITAAVALLIGFGLGSQLMPKIESKTVEVQTEKVVKDVVTVIKVVTRPDGTKEETSTTTDKSTEAKNSKSTAVVIAKADWHVNLNASKDLTASSLTYTVNVDRRILGDLFLGASISSDKKLGASIGVEF